MTRRPTRRTPAVALTLAAGTLLLATGCGADAAGAKHAAGPTETTTLAPVQSGLVKVGAVDNFFKADTVTVTAGSKVSWTNAGRNDHNVTPVDGTAFGVGTADFKPGESYTATFATPGTYHYFCTIHGTNNRGMVGTIEVVAP